jgi:MFS family permease
MTSQQDPSPLALSDQSAHTEQQSKRGRAWTLAIVSIGLFMDVLDNLVVSVALPSIRRELGASIQSLEWTVNAYVLAYAVLLLTGAALGDRFGRRRMFAFGIGLFTLSSAGAALAGSADLLIAARALQGVGAAIATPLTLRRSRRSAAALRSGSGRGSAGSLSRLGRSSAAPSCRRRRGTGSSGSTCRSVSCSFRSR